MTKAKGKQLTRHAVNKSRPEAVNTPHTAKSPVIDQVILNGVELTALKLALLKVVTNLQVELACANDNLRAIATPLRTPGTSEHKAEGFSALGG